MLTAAYQIEVRNARSADGDMPMTRDELAALRDALEAVLAWPDAVRVEVARWLAPAAAKPNGRDSHPPPIAPTSAEVPKRNISSPRRSPAPYAGKASRARPTSAKTAEQRLIAAMRENPGLSVAALANAANASRSSTGERLRRLSEAGVVEKDNAGRWRLKAAEEAEPRPMTGASVELTAAPEAHHIDDGPAPTHQPWIRKLAAYDRRETSEMHGTRYG